MDSDRSEPSDGSITCRDAGRLGGHATRAKRGHEFYIEIGRKGGMKVRELIEAGRRAEARTP